ncbi:hypothetical protein GCM10008949_39510 [Deinococcus humi]|nr:hypothetical protein GCM10008949_39510 [Deinococcus humi]
MAQLSAAVCLLASPAARAASPLPVTLSAWSDARALPSETALQGLLEQGRARKCEAAGIDLTRLLPDQLEAYHSMERLLSTLPPSDPSRATFENTFARMHESYAAAAPLPPPSVPATLAEALKNAQGWLQQHEAAGVKAFSASPEAKDAGRASRAALVASMLGKPNAALAALLAAHQLAPGDPQHLANLGGVLVTLGLPGDALTVLDAAAKLNQSPSGALGWSSSAVLNTSRGLALTTLRRFPEAEAALRSAVAAEPMLSEANLGLSHALTCQGKLSEAARFARAGQRRTPSRAATPATPTQTAPEEVRATTRTGPDALTRLPTAFTFDLSGGRETALPDLKLPQTPADAQTLLPGYLKLTDDLIGRMKALRDRADEIDRQLRERTGLPVVRARRDALWAAILSVEEEPGLKALVSAQAKTGAEPGALVQDFFYCSGGCIYEQIILKSRSQEEVQAQCVPALEAQNNKWRSAMHNHANQLGAYLKKGYQLRTALAANYSDPLWHERASLTAEIFATATWYGYVGLAQGWAQAITQNIHWESCVKGSASAAPPVTPELALPRADSCKDLFDDRAFSFSVDVLSFKISCDTIQMGTASPGWIGAFGQLNHTFGTEEYTVTVGVQQGVSVPGTSVALESKQGVYVTWGEGGLTDAGVSVKTGVKVGIKGGSDTKATGSDEIDALSGKWSFVASKGR